MVVNLLNEKNIEAGQKLLNQLDKSNIKVDAALWFYFEDIESWKLIIALPDLSKFGPKMAYKEVQKAINKLGTEIDISLNDVAISKPDSSLLNLFKIAIKTSTGIHNIRFSNNIINGHLIKDSYIYRLN